MSTRVPLVRVARILATGLLLVTILPAAASAAQDPDTCGANTATTYTTPAPAGLRTPGTHRIQWKAEFTDAYTGERIVDDGIVNQITFDSAAPAYPNAVLIRLFRNTTLLANGEVVSVDTIRPTQEARMYVNVSWLKGDKFFSGDFEMSFRYETSKNKWSAYQRVAAGPEQSFCVELTDAIWRKSYGWG
jgi:hypothetical protein